MMTRLILIRHGETDYNLHSMYCGFSDPPLNNTGLLQAQKVKEKMKHVKVDKVFSSDLKRAHEMARIIFEGMDIEKLPELREMNFGVFEGLKHEEIMAKYSKVYTEWIDNPDKIKIPEGEHLLDVEKRINYKIMEICDSFRNKTIAIIMHQGPVRVLLCKILGYDRRMFWQVKQENGAINIIDYDDNFIPKIIALNDTAHL